MTGTLITFEGPEGSGKSTQLKFVARYLQAKGYRPLVLREPGGTPISEAIRKILLDTKFTAMQVETELFLYLAARAQLVREVIQPALAKGRVVLCDRFEDSTLAYQALAGGLGLARVRRAAQVATGGLTPDLTFLLDVDSRQGLKRGGRHDRMEHKSIAFHRRVRQGFLQLAKAAPHRFCIIAATTTLHKARERIRKRLDQIFA